MQRRRLLLMVLGLTGFAVLGVGFIAWLTGPKYRVTVGSIQAIHPGMSLEAVESILGPAARQGEVTRRSWDSKPFDGWLVDVVFDEQDKVTDVVLMDTFRAPQPESILDKLRRWLGL